MAWMKATPMTPWATARMVAVDKRGEFAAARHSRDALEDRQDAARARLAEGHDDAGDDERGQELQNPAADTGDETQRGFGQVADLRLLALDQRRQIGVRLRPQRMYLLADQRPFLHAGTRRRNLPACCSAHR